MLRAGTRDTHRVGFLKCIIADQMRGHLPGQTNNGNTVHQRIREPGNGIRRTWTAGHKQDADFPGRACVSFSRVCSTLFVAHENVSKLVLLKQFVINRQNGAARIAEDDINTLIKQGLNDNLPSVHTSLYHRSILSPGATCRKQHATREATAQGHRIADPAAYFNCADIQSPRGCRHYAVILWWSTPFDE